MIGKYNEIVELLTVLHAYKHFPIRLHDTLMLIKI